MKYVILLCDGMADRPTALPGGKTPMEAAYKPCMDALASRSRVGLVKTVDDGLSPGSDVANLSVMGYDPLRCYTGRSPLEAASIGVEMNENDLTFRCNLVTLSDAVNYSDCIMEDYCAGDISTEEASLLIKAVDDALGNEAMRFYPGVSYRHCLLVRDGAGLMGELSGFTPPHDISGKVIGPYLPSTGKGLEFLSIMEKSREILSSHPVNADRVARGKRPANSVWLWGCGRKPALDDFYGLYGVKAAVVSAVDLIKGIGILAGMKVCSVEGATGYVDTNFEGKAEAAVSALKNGYDLVYIHVEAPDECGHRGEAENKVRAIELIDEKILAPVKKALDEMGEYSIMILPDHPTPLDVRTHTGDPVPYMIYRSGRCEKGVSSFTENNAAGGDFVDRGCRLMDIFLGRNGASVPAR